MTSFPETTQSQRISQSKKTHSTPQTSRKEAKDKEPIVAPSIRTSLQGLDKQVIMTGTAVPQSVKTFRIKKKDPGSFAAANGMNSKESQESERNIKDYTPLSMHGLRNYTKHRRNATKAPDPLRDIYLFDNKPLHLKKASTNFDLDSDSTSRRYAKNASPAFKVNVTVGPKLKLEDMSLNMQKVRLEKIIGADAAQSTDRSHLNASVVQNNNNTSLPPIVHTDLDQRARMRRRKIRNTPTVSVSPFKDKLPFTNVTDLDDSNSPRGFQQMTELEQLETTKGDITYRSHRERSENIVVPKRSFIMPVIPKDMMIISGHKSSQPNDGRRILKMNKAYRILMHKDSRDGVMLGRQPFVEDPDSKKKPIRSSNEVIEEEITENLTRKDTPVIMPFKGLGTTRMNEQLRQFTNPSGASIANENSDEGDYHPSRRLRGLLGSMNKDKESFDGRLNQTDNFGFSLQVLKDNSAPQGRSDLGINFLTSGDVISTRRKVKKSTEISQDNRGEVEPKTLLEKKLLTQYGNTDALDGWDHNESPTGFDVEYGPDSYSEILMKRTRS